MTLMKNLKTISKLSVILATVFISAQLFYEISIRSSDTRLDQWSRSINYIEKNKAEVIFFDDSDGVYALRHDLMGEAFLNLSFFSERPNFHYPKLQSILERPNKIKAIVIPADHVSLHRWGTNIHKLYYYSDLNQIDKSLKFDSFYNNNKNFVITYNTFEYFFPIIKDYERKKMLGNIVKNTSAIFQSSKPREKGLSDCLTLKLPENGYFSASSLATKPEADLEKIVDQYFTQYVEEMTFDERSALVWLEMITFAQKNNIKVIGLRHPTYLFKEKRKKLNQEKMNEFFEAANFDLIIDNHDLFDNSPQYFNDPTHLNPTGSIVYSKIVRDQIGNFLPEISQKEFDCTKLGKKFSQMPTWPYTNVFKRN